MAPLPPAIGVQVKRCGDEAKRPRAPPLPYDRPEYVWRRSNSSPGKFLFNASSSSARTPAPARILDAQLPHTPAAAADSGAERMVPCVAYWAWAATRESLADFIAGDYSFAFLRSAWAEQSHPPLLRLYRDVASCFRLVFLLLLYLLCLVSSLHHPFSFVQGRKFTLGGEYHQARGFPLTQWSGERGRTRLDGLFASRSDLLFTSSLPFTFRLPLSRALCRRLYIFNFGDERRVPPSARASLVSRSQRGRARLDRVLSMLLCVIFESPVTSLFMGARAPKRHVINVLKRGPRRLILERGASELSHSLGRRSGERRRVCTASLFTGARAVSPEYQSQGGGRAVARYWSGESRVAAILQVAFHGLGRLPPALCFAEVEVYCWGEWRGSASFASFASGERSHTRVCAIDFVSPHGFLFDLALTRLSSPHIRTKTKIRPSTTPFLPRPVGGTHNSSSEPATSRSAGCECSISHPGTPTPHQNGSQDNGGAASSPKLPDVDVCVEVECTRAQGMRVGRKGFRMRRFVGAIEGENGKRC
ncbi:hypothetical protein B0H13DRAFT_1850348 [Mycena leptocephala]|nr:hypothetical protein B0H13DRAFT_1850348 [Mycena leptocephala]